MNITDRKEREEFINWTKENLPLGKLLGYQPCCIKAFCLDYPSKLKKRKRTNDDLIRLDASYMNGKYTGYIPCLDHAIAIKKGKIKLTDLIKDRDQRFPPFPDYAPFY